MLGLVTRTLRLLPGALAALLLADLAHGQAAEPARESSGDVRLVVLVVVDQLIPEQLERLSPWLDGGLGRFVHDGERWRAALHPHGITETGPGHATLATGLYPARHGIVSNEWMAAETGDALYCVDDDEACLVTSAGQGVDASGARSPKNLRASGIADHLKAADPASRCVGIAAKDRSAILALGMHADLALWWDLEGRGFVTSDWYAPELPAFVRDWNGRWPAELVTEQGTRAWEAALPEGIEASGMGRDDQPGETPLGPTRTFPHPGPPCSIPPTEKELARLAEFAFASPSVDRFVVELARGAVDAFELGSDEHVDYLFVGLSACDVVGHASGPTSPEVTDLLLRDDRALGELFASLDQRIGAERWIAALSSDHGVMELPERLRERGLEAGRIPTKGTLATIKELRATLAGEFGIDPLARLGEHGARLSEERMHVAGADPSNVRARVKELFLSRFEHIHALYTSDELAATLLHDDGSDGLRTAMARSFFPGRSPDVMAVKRPFWIAMATGTTHGSPWNYDRAVPLVFIGPHATHGSSFEPCSTVDVLPTLLSRAGVVVPTGLDGRVLVSALPLDAR